MTIVVSINRCRRPTETATSYTGHFTGSQSQSALCSEASADFPTRTGCSRGRYCLAGSRAVSYQGYTSSSALEDGYHSYRAAVVGTGTERVQVAAALDNTTG